MIPKIIYKLVTPLPDGNIEVSSFSNANDYDRQVLTPEEFDKLKKIMPSVIWCDHIIPKDD